MQKGNVYIPTWLSFLLDEEINFINKSDIFKVAEKEYGKLSFSDRELLDDYLNDLMEEGFIYQIGNLIYKNKSTIEVAA